ncbi:MAG: hypothetical protein COY58_09760 [Gammaproteobacteria bacterium CG_4_10_14_0_8_um_filter_38_16]|nr:MAG: hypothetical protein COY58_09760 [Gammaproteobacteria bacterium CG_4_10_14_0_8_um_filter_38_16]PJA03031.1 MAG: hypothetical protein COX72_06905 [Gammaproteobacteria bacterium CG_4_10_14_0_2_um_filter_38_22]PJB10239.1 MAG: hypothetical protein CO120_06010 [Gammaproteobacteria bacterium CG_4_9_14_3_um_filter_38_9]
MPQENQLNESPAIDVVTAFSTLLLAAGAMIGGTTACGYLGLLTCGSSGGAFLVSPGIQAATAGGFCLTGSAGTFCASRYNLSSSESSNNALTNRMT